MIELIIRLTPPLTLLLAVLLLLRPWVLERLGARFQYGLWLCVPILLLTLLLPIISPPSIAAMETYRVTVSTLSHGANQSDVMSSLYLAGLTLAMAALGISALHLNRLIRRATPAQCNNIKNRLNLLTSAETDGPFVFGLLRPTVVLPESFEARFSDKEQEFILAHELCHWRRGDLHCNLLALALLCLCWFNPLCLLAYRRFRQDQEMACDADVTIVLNQTDRIAYSRALIGNATATARNWQPLSHHYGDKHTMKQRLMQLKHSKGFSTTSLLPPLALVATLGLWAQAPAIAGNQEQKSPDPVALVEPHYPSAAASKHIEGYIQAKFDISNEGTVSNIVIIKSEPEGVFDKAAIDALSQWRYEPKASTSNLVQLDFKLSPPKTSNDKASTDTQQQYMVQPHDKTNH